MVSTNDMQAIKDEFMRISSQATKVPVDFLQGPGTDNFFHIDLIDEGLRDIDPDDPNLTEDIKRRIIQECKNNLMYFLMFTLHGTQKINAGIFLFLRQVEMTMKTNTNMIDRAYIEQMFKLSAEQRP
jgi:hypothetical protein